MESSLYTEAASRALHRMQLIADHYKSSEIHTLHLFLALMTEESRATELLAKAGLNEINVEKEFSVSISELQNSIFQNDPEQLDSKELYIPQSDELKQIVNEAVLFAKESGRHVEVGSEHLLWGLSRVRSQIEKYLSSYSIVPEKLRESVHQVTGVSFEPLESDEQLRFQDVAPKEETGFLRIIDASANRAREGLRVLEDYVRFVMDDRFLSASLKECRHSLAEVFKLFPSLQVTSSRDTLTDVGTEITTATEKSRQSSFDIIRANFKRVQEAIRSLEEYSKILEPESSGRFEKIRYQLYTVEKAVENSLSSSEQLKDCFLYLLVSENLCHHGSGPAIRESITHGVDIVQVREKEMNNRQLIEHGLRVREWTAEAGVILIMNDRPDIASAVGADGVHLGRDDMTVSQARKIMGTKSIIGMSTHTIEQARQAVMEGADYIGVGPTFPSKTKHFDEFAGLDFIKQVSEEIRIPWFAIGGIDQANLNQVMESGADRIAVSSAICGSSNPAKQASSLKAQLTSQ
jgi:thiamine-phosphate pyrophosphorylase